MTSGSGIDTTMARDGALASRPALRAHFQAGKDVAADDPTGVLIIASERDATVLGPATLNRAPFAAT